jgi:hypothetical protein
MGNIVRGGAGVRVVATFRAGAEAPSKRGLDAALKGRSSTMTQDAALKRRSSTVVATT